MADQIDVLPVPLGMFWVPGREVAKYNVKVRAPYVVCAYLVKHPAGTLLFDTGIVADSEAVQRYTPRGFDLEEQLSAAGCTLDEIDVVVNCHLHADHAGGNHLLAGKPIIVQRRELDAARQSDYTVREAAIDFPNANLVVIDGAYEIMAGVRVVPTHGHSPGHQSLMLNDTSEGAVLLAGQAFDEASEYALAELAHELGTEPLDVTAPDWMDDLRNIDVAYFAHDLAQWRPRPTTMRGSTALTAWSS